MSRSVLPLTLLALSACPSEPEPGGEEPESVSTWVTPEEGADIELDDGTTLRIPPGAVEEEVEVTVTSAVLDDPDGAMVAGVVLEPSGLTFAAPATLELPLPGDGWVEGDLLVYEGVGNDPVDALPSGPVAGVEDGRSITEVHHFSSSVVSLNCHSGTIKHVLADFVARGCDREDMLDAINERYPGLDLNEGDCAWAESYDVQGLLDSHFDDVGGWDAGQPVPGDVLARAKAAAAEGRQVVFAFGGGPWAERDGEHDFYPSRNIIHTATLRSEGGQMVLHNTVVTHNKALRSHFGGKDVTATWSVDDVDTFRSLQSGVALEISICGSPGCLETADNPVGAQVFRTPLDARGVPWPAVRIYVERSAGTDNPCDPHEQFLTSEVSIPGYTNDPFEPDLAAGGLAEITSGGELVLGGIPAVVGIEGTPTMPTSVLTIAFHPSLPGPDLYANFGDVSEGAQVDLSFGTDEVVDDGPWGTMILFSATAGGVDVSHFGTQIGDPLRGTFDVNIAGERRVCLDPGCDEASYETVTGSLTGAFNVVIVPEESVL